MQTSCTVLAAVEKIKFFIDKIETKTKFHITIGHQTVVGLVHLFSFSDNNDQKVEQFVFNKSTLKNLKNDFNFNKQLQYQFESELVGDGTLPSAKKVEETKGEENKI